MPLNLLSGRLGSMIQRLALNSETLQKEFSAIYRDFFSRCQCVASASNSFLWFGEFSGFYGGLTISQKLPVRSYVGFETTFDQAVTVNREYQTFDSKEQQFVTAVADDRLCAQLANYIEKKVKNQSAFTGLRVHLLTEVPLGHSLGSNGAIAAALTLLLTTDSSEKDLFTVARDILSLSQAGHSSGVSAYMALTDLQGPVLFQADSERVKARALAKLAGLESLPIWPIDFGLIYCGLPTHGEGVILANQQTVAELEEREEGVRQLLKQPKPLNWRQTYLDMLNMTTGLGLTAFIDLFKKGSNPQVLESLFSSLNQYQNLLRLLHLSNNAIDLIYSQIHQLANKQTNDVGSGVKISGIGQGGAVLFALPYGVHRSAIEQLIKRLQDETGRAISLDYASWLDGLETHPARLEQDLARGQRSLLIGRDALLLTVLHHGHLREQIVSNDRLAEWQADCDLLLDQTSGKLIVGGQAMTSKELPSQKATVEIVTRLIKARHFTLKNSDLPSSYGANRYDLHGKIVLPLVKQVKQRTGRDLQLIVRGGMLDQYSLILNPSNLIIGSIKRKL